MPSRTLASDAKIHISSLADLHTHFDDLYDDLHSPETEHTWQKIERALLYIQAITRGGATKYPEFVALLKDASSPICNALLSERTKLSGTAGDLLNSIAPRMAERFEPLVSVFVPTLLLICARTNKVAVKRAEKSLHFIVKHCRPPAVVGYLKEAIKDKGQGLRAVAAATLVVVLEHTEKERLQRRVTDIEGCIKSGATDSNVEVRQTTKVIFERYVAMWPERVEGFTRPMTPTIRRYLSLPKTGALVVEVLPLTESSKSAPATRAPQTQPSRHDEAQAVLSHAPPTRPQPGYNFFPDLPKSSSAASSSTARNAGFSMNDASYGKRGLFAEQIAAARNARLARMPSFNFDDLAKTDTIKRQPSFDQLRTPAAPPAATTFRVPRFDVVVAPPARQDSNERVRDGYAHGDINATTPSFASASGLHGKSALLAAYKQAFEGGGGTAKPPSSSRKEKSSKHSENRREKTVAVRFDSVDDKDDAAAAAADTLHRSKSAPYIAVTDKLKADDEAKGDWIDSDEEEQTRPTTPPERILHAQTPKTGVKASRVPAQRVMMPSAVKVSAIRVAVQTPKVAVAARTASLSADSSPVPKARTVKVEAQEEGDVKEEKKEEVEVAVVEKQPEVKDKEKEPATKKQKETVKEKPLSAPTAVKKPATTSAASKQPVKPVVTAKATPSASLAAKARLEARAAARPAAATTASGETKKPVPKSVSTTAKPTAVRKPVTSSTTTASKSIAKPTAAAVKAKPLRAAKSSTSSAFSTTVRAKSATSTTSKPPTTSTQPSKRTSTLTASTASTRNKIVPSASVKKFQPKPASSSVKSVGVQKKSSIAVSLKGRVGVNGKKEEAVRKAVVSAVKGIERQRRVSQVGGRKKEAAGEGEVAAVVAVAVEKGVEGGREAEMVEDKLEDEVVVQEKEPAGDKAVASAKVVESEPGVETASTAETSTERESVTTPIPDTDAVETTSDAQADSTPADEEAAPPLAVVPTPPAKTPLLTGTANPAKVRTPLSSKNTNLPRSTPVTSIGKAKSSPLISPHHLRSPAASFARISASSPLRRSTPSRVDISSSFEESESESEDDDEEEQEVVQLRFGKAATKQLVVGLESEDGSVVEEVGEGDETVLLDHAV